MQKMKSQRWWINRRSFILEESTDPLRLDEVLIDSEQEVEIDHRRRSI